MSSHVPKIRAIIGTPLPSLDLKHTFSPKKRVAGGFTTDTKNTTDTKKTPLNQTSITTTIALF